MPAARSSGDKSDLPGRVVVKHPPGRLRPPHPFNSSAGVVKRGGGSSMQQHNFCMHMSTGGDSSLDTGRDKQFGLPPTGTALGASR
ncbi:hypothetical protein JOQ06_017165, partial [Pogonophryne albipinna]